MGNTGNFILVHSGMSPYNSGAISLTQTDIEGISGENYNRRGILSFDASKSNSIYSTSDTVQPSAAQALIIIKT